MDATGDRKQLIEENYDLIFSFLEKKNLQYNDYYDIAAIGLCDAASSYNYTIPFQTHAFRCMNVAVRCKTDMCEMTDNFEINDLMTNIITSDNDIDDMLITNMIDSFRNTLISDSYKRLFELLIQGYSQAEICKILGITKSRLSTMRYKLGQKFLNFYY